MRRTRLRAALLVVVAAALVGIGYEVSRSIRARKGHTRLDLGADFIPEVAQHIRNFRRVKVEHGRMMWEITAEDARYFEKQDEVVVREPRVTLFLSDGARQAHIAGTEGHLRLEGRELRMLTLQGSVMVQLDDLEMRTETATYERTRDLITAPGPVSIRGRTLDVRARGMEVEITPQHVRLLDDVHTVVRSNAAAS
jgi:LPS export ABC transporter protein LptC